MTNSIFLSKSDFQLASTCAKKLVYKKKGYPSANDTNEYMEMLAQGGYVVGKMATLLFPKGIEIEENTEIALINTKEQIESNDSIILFEPAFEFNQRLVRIDIFVKNGNNIQLIEVKSASFDSFEPIAKQKKLKKYIQDISFQYTILKDLFPDCAISCLLLMPDKSISTSIDGFAGWFNIKEPVKNDEEIFESPQEIITKDKSRFQKPVVEFIYENATNVDWYLNELKSKGILNYLDVTEEAKNIESVIRVKADSYIDILNNQLEIKPSDYSINKECKSCEFYVADNPKCGFFECWPQTTSMPGIFDLYYGGTLGGNQYLNNLIKEGKYNFEDIDNTMFSKADGSIGSRGERQFIQYENTILKTEWFSNDLKSELESFAYPLHFIDFETYTGAMPFHKDMVPYELIAFQWSCHTISEPGAEPTHEEFISTSGEFPNFKFVESLMKHIGLTGTPFMWATHENSVLRTIYRQMDIFGYANPTLKSWLEQTIKDIELGTNGRFVDMNDMTKRHYFHPDMKGKTSIKKVLPAIWNNNLFLHEIPYLAQYSAKDFENNVLDPYDTLYQLASESIISEGEEMMETEGIKGGTAAMRAYYRVRFDHQISQGYKDELKNRLLEYCKLDTMAMVIIWLYWKYTGYINLCFIIIQSFFT